MANIKALTAAIFAVTLAWLATSPAQGVQDSTEPVGFYKHQLQPGPNLFVAGLVTRKEFQGSLSGFAAGTPNSTLSVTGADWTTGAFNESSGQVPTHYVEIIQPGHSAEGTVLDIVANTSDSLTVAANAAEIAGLGLSGTENICIRSHSTLFSIFKNSAVTPWVDIVRVYNSDLYTGGGDPIVSYIFDGANWRNFNTFALADNRIVYPGQGLFILSDSAKELVIGGDVLAHVKSTPTRVNSYASAGFLNLVGHINPLSAQTTPLGSLGFQDWLAPFIDLVFLFVPDVKTNGQPYLRKVGTYYFNGAQMVNQATSQASDSVPVRNGSSLGVLSAQDMTILLPSGL